jgi:hypothetical protein
MPSFRMIMLSNAAGGRDDEFERWYDEVHLPDMLKVPGFVAAQRFRIDKNLIGKTPYAYCTIYEVEAESADAAIAATGAAMQSGKMVISDAADVAGSQGFFCEAVRDRVTAS